MYIEYFFNSVEVTHQPDRDDFISPQPKPQTYRNKKYLAWVAKQPCCVCSSRVNVYAHHEGFGRRGTGLKAPDTHAVPLCNRCHTDRHCVGAQTFWHRALVDPKMTVIILLTEYLQNAKGG